MKLIDWQQAPRLIMTHEGEFLSLHGDYAQVLHTWRQGREYSCIKDVPLSQVRLSPADQQPWLVYKEGVTVIPEWAKVIIVGFYDVHGYRHQNRDICVTLKVDCAKKLQANVAMANYKIIGIKEGWTDSPEAAE
jgi:hypothetical protein